MCVHLRRIQVYVYRRILNYFYVFDACATKWSSFNELISVEIECIFVSLISVWVDGDFDNVYSWVI